MNNTEIRDQILQSAVYFVKWTVTACVTGVLGGAAGTVFGYGIRLSTELFASFPWLLFLLPASGCAIVFLYKICGEEKNRGTNLILESVSSGEAVPLATGPLIFVSTILTHLTGGSAGREGAALQLGGSIGALVGRTVRFDEKDRKIAVMCGMSACFGALFGTPLAAGIFSMEVACVGSFYCAALLPCLFASFAGAGVARMAGLPAEHYGIGAIPPFAPRPAAIIVLLGILCAAVSILFCFVLHTGERLYKKYFPNPFVRVLAGSAIVIGLTLLFGTRVYNGSGAVLIEEAVEGHARYEAFLLKMLFTAATLGAGYKGGEIVPALSVGAAFGCAFGTLLGFSPSLCAACGMAALFTGVTNCPVSGLLIAFELCGFGAMPYFALVIAVAFALSGYGGLYGAQRFASSKTRAN